MKCFKNKANETLNRSHCDIIYPLERDLGYWEINQTWFDRKIEYQ